MQEADSRQERVEARLQARLRRLERALDIVEAKVEAMASAIKATAEADGRYKAWLCKITVAGEMARLPLPAMDFRDILIALSDFPDQWWTGKGDLSVAEWLVAIRKEAARRRAPGLHLLTQEHI